MENLYKKM